MRKVGRFLSLLFSKSDFYRTILDSIPDGVIAIDLDGRVVVWNKAVVVMTGVEADQMIGKGDFAASLPFYGERRPLLVDLVLMGPIELAKYRNYYSRLDCKADTLTAEGFAPLVYGGKGMWFWSVASPIRDRRGRVVGAVQCIRDITDRKKMEEELKFLSMRDPLTGVYNRAYFEEEMKRMQKGRFYPISLLMCDLDNLKMVNDFLGHQKGDEALRLVAKVLVNSVRSSDVVARVGGDEFAVLLPKTDKASAEKVVKRILEAMKELAQSRPDLPLSLSVGYATQEGPFRPLEALYSEADDAMYRDKILRGLSPRSSVLQVLRAALREKDFGAEGHIDRVKQYSLMLGEALGLGRNELELLELLAEVHDIGKIAVSNQVLFKPGALTEEEWEEIKRHPEVGYRIAQTSVELQPVARLILEHHERWNGKGYPSGLKGGEIHLLSRIVAIADAYDAMTSDRPYRRAMTEAEALEELERAKGAQFDPVLVDLFVDIIKGRCQGRSFS